MPGYLNFFTSILPNCQIRSSFRFKLNRCKQGQAKSLSGKVKHACFTRALLSISERIGVSSQRIGMAVHAHTHTHKQMNYNILLLLFDSATPSKQPNEPKTETMGTTITPIWGIYCGSMQPWAQDNRKQHTRMFKHTHTARDGNNTRSGGREHTNRVTRGTSQAKPPPRSSRVQMS